MQAQDRTLQDVNGWRFRLGWNFSKARGFPVRAGIRSFEDRFEAVVVGEP
jgi:hypothetical protein